MRSRLHAKFSSCKDLLSTLNEILYAKTKFYLHRATASVCRVQHVFKLVPARLSYRFAQDFDSNELLAYAKPNEVRVSSQAASQIHLRTSDRGHGFISLPRSVYTSYASILITSAPLRVTDPTTSHLNEEVYRRCARSRLHSATLNLPSLRPENYVPYHSSLGSLEPESLLQRPESVYTFLLQVLHKQAARVYCEDSLREDFPNPTAHLTESVRR